VTEGEGSDENAGDWRVVGVVGRYSETVGRGAVGCQCVFCKRYLVGVLVLTLNHARLTLTTHNSQKAPGSAHRIQTLYYIEPRHLFRKM
jgi:hypothetical protein